MAKPSWRQLDAQKIIKRNDQGMWARPDAIRIVPGFNLRDVDAPGYREDIESLKAHMRRGGKVPALEVCLSDDGLGVDVVDGHRRTEAYRELMAEGAEIAWIRIDQFEGNDKERHARILTSQDNRKLLPLELAEGYRRMKTLFGMSNDELAGLVGKSRQHVEQMLLLSQAPHVVQEMVRSGALASSVAVQEVREHGDASAKVLSDKLQAAKNSGKGRVTAGALRPWSPPRRAFIPMMSAVGAVVSAIPEHVRQAMAAAEAKPAPDEMVSLPAAVLYELLAQQGAIDNLREKAARKSGAAQSPNAEEGA